MKKDPKAVKKKGVQDLLEHTNQKLHALEQYVSPTLDNPGHKNTEKSIEDRIVEWDGIPKEINPRELYTTVGCLSCNRQFREVSSLLATGAPPEELSAALVKLGDRLVKLTTAAFKLETVDKYIPMLNAVEPIIKATRSNVGRVAAVGKHKEANQKLDIAGAVARRLWLDGDKMKHDAMKNYLLDEYQEVGGIYPFSDLNATSLLKTLKKVARDLGRPELITGEKNLTS